MSLRIAAVVTPLATAASLVVSLVVSISCKGGAAERAGETGAPASVAAASTPTPTPILTPTPTQTPTPPPTPAPTATPPPDGGGACRVVRGPIELPLRGPAALLPKSDSVDAVLDDDGKPRSLSWPVGPVPNTAGAREPAAGGSAAGIAVACAIAADRVYCPDRSGAVHRTGRAGGEDRVVASSRSGSRVAAAALGTHAALAYLASRKTSEGWVSEAWIDFDDEPPVRLSDDGSGATSIALVPRGAELLALSIDARSALTAMHARAVAYDHGAKLGEDVVVFVGGPGDRRTAAAVVAPDRGPAWALLPISKDVGSFGLALVKLEQPPRVDEPVTWSMYPNGLDPAPTAAVAVGSRTWVARVRPVEAAVGSAKVLEIGEVGAGGDYVGRDVVPASGATTDVTLANDAHGAIWIAWVDGAGSWVERMACK